MCGGRSLQECLLIQARSLGMEDSVVEAILLRFCRKWKAATINRSPGA